MPKPNTNEICGKLGFPSVSDQLYKECVSRFKRVWLRKKHSELLPRPVALGNDNKTQEQESGLRQQYSEFPTHWGDANLVNCRIAGTCCALSPGDCHGLPHNCHCPCNYRCCYHAYDPCAKHCPPDYHDPLATTSPLATSSPLSTSSTVITKKRPGVFDHKEDPEPQARPLTNWPRQVDLPELQFMSFTVLFRGLNSTQVESTSYASISEFHRLANITLRNEEYQDHFGVEQVDSVERVISDQGSWNAAVMATQGNCPTQSSFAGLSVVAIHADADDWQPGRDNSEPQDKGEGPLQPADLPGTKESTGGWGAMEVGDIGEDVASGQNDNVDD
ncbi:hypothetical protein HOY80DRAFT_1042628 [Tuber brumale]|nr:hypothetical protein HOY80DRAFT_1042628 [Tuber brumale]